MLEQLYLKYTDANYQVSTDTREIIPGSLFFALRGDNFNGNIYATEAIKKGAIAAVIDDPKFNNENTILVDNSLKSLQDLANLHRQKCSFNVLALTGTNGKTTTKDLIHNVLSRKYICHVTKGNLNNHIGVPLTILSAPKETEIMVVEMGANHIGEIASLCAIAKPNCGLITNIGKAHLEGFGGFEGVIKAKNEMYTYLIENNGCIFINSTNSLLMKLAGDYTNLQMYGSKDSKVYASETNYNEGLVSEIIIDTMKYSVRSQLFGNYNLDNILTAIKIGMYFKIPVSDIISAIGDFKPENNRSQITKTKNNTLILDSYNANPSSMKAALNSFSEINNEKKVLILGGMKELGDSSKEEHLQLIKHIRTMEINTSYLVGEEYKNIEMENEKYFANTDDFISFLKNTKIKDKLILVKGSRANQLEKVKDYL